VVEASIHGAPPVGPGPSAFADVDPSILLPGNQLPPLAPDSGVRPRALHPAGRASTLTTQ